MAQENSINNNYLQDIVQRAAPRVINAIKSAAAKTGVDFSYLVEKAAAESNMKADAKSRHSSASGLFQFIESTWLKMVKAYGDKYGMEKYASCIDEKGCVADPALRREILALRNDPEKASFMAAEFASENQRYLKRSLGPDADIGSTEMYLAHFMGAGGASEFLKKMENNPDQSAADIFPRAARSNRSIFFDKNGQERSLADVYARFDNKFNSDQDIAVTRPAPTPATASDIPTSRLSRDTAMQLLVMQDEQSSQATIDILTGVVDEERTANIRTVARERVTARLNSYDMAALQGRPVPSAEMIAMGQIRPPVRIPQYNS